MPTMPGDRFSTREILRIFGSSMCFRIIIFVIVISLASCSGHEESQDKVDKSIEPNVCECHELTIDEGYNHFYYAERKKGFNGTCNELYPNGVKKLEKNFYDGKVHGKMTEWYSDGSIKSQREFDMNLQVGEQIDFNKDGEVIFHAVYENGTQTKVIVNRPDLRTAENS